MKYEIYGNINLNLDKGLRVAPSTDDDGKSYFSNSFSLSTFDKDTQIRIKELLDYENVIEYAKIPKKIFVRLSIIFGTSTINTAISYQGEAGLIRVRRKSGGNYYTWANGILLFVPYSDTNHIYKLLIEFDSTNQEVVLKGYQL